MNKITDIVLAAVEEKPDAFKTALDVALQDVIAQHIAAYKLQLQQEMLGVEEQQPETEEAEEVEPSEEEIEEALTVAVEEYLEAHPDESEEQAIEAVLTEIEKENEEEVDGKKTD